MSAVIALDPGKTTGIAIHISGIDPEQNFFGEADFDTTCDTVEGYARHYGTDLTIVSESFLITQHTAKNTQAPWSLELIGVFRRYARQHTKKDLILQAPSQAKRFSSDDRLKLMGYYTKGKGHANDAARHLLVYEATRGRIPAEMLQRFALVS